MSSILDTSSLYNTYSQTASNAVSSTLQSSLGNVSDTSSDDQLLEALNHILYKKSLNQLKQRLQMKMMKIRVSICSTLVIS